jgi:two-component system, NarL family, nitrate/nitrite response regulator NarL
MSTCDPATGAVLVVDPLPLFRDALARVVHRSPALRVVAEVPDGAAALEALRRLRPGLALVSAHDGALDPLALLRRIDEERLRTRCVVVLAPRERKLAYAALAAGAAGCVTRSAEPAEFLDALRAAAAGGVHLARELHAPVVEEIRFREHARGALLSEREGQVLRAVAAGHTAAVIARDLHVGVTTVKSHMGSAYGKLGVSDRAAAVAVAMRRGLLD